ncbi:hypothetical protein SFV1gp08 [Sulfolobus filamentous virus 1]|uniref:Uncharacterized protein n=2 Tax=Alphalipothrixvirus beppuense TaxID=2734584 RepID=A0A346LU47_SUFV1|nr:hypothetical protein HOT91_gp08 [Sulfolobus filamentous virus 1]AXQ00090.1 hypothetical protein SFV1gp08 [Sulfolobus filamentous virus 1]AZI75710.1 hypothetical protein SBFV1_gp09 [Sulfolobales Beppu filamentous phage 1]
MKVAKKMDVQEINERYVEVLDILLKDRQKFYLTLITRGIIVINKDSLYVYQQIIDNTIQIIDNLATITNEIIKNPDINKNMLSEKNLKKFEEIRNYLLRANESLKKESEAHELLEKHIKNIILFQSILIHEIIYIANSTIGQVENSLDKKAIEQMQDKIIELIKKITT